MRCIKPSERCASTTKPSGALSFLQAITAAPMLRKLPLDLDHFVSPGCEQGVVVLQTLQLTRHTTFSDFFGFQNGRLRPPKFPLSFASSTSKYAISA